MSMTVKEFKACTCCIVKRLYNVDEAAVYLGLTEKALWEIIYDGGITVVKRSPRRVQLDKHDMDSHIEECKTKCLKA